MKKIIMLTSLALTLRAVAPNTLVECSDEEAGRFLEANMARELLKHEPTELQLAEMVVLEPPLVAVETGEGAAAVAVSDGQTAPNVAGTADAKPKSKTRKSAPPK